MFYPKKTLNKPTAVQNFIKFRRCMLNISLQTTPGCECCQAETEICTCHFKYTQQSTLCLLSQWINLFRKCFFFFQTQTGCISCANKWANALTSANQKKCTRLRVRCLQSSWGRNQLIYIVSDWLNKMALFSCARHVHATSPSIIGTGNSVPLNRK